MQTGRQIIWCDELEVTRDNIIEVLQDAIRTHQANAADCQELLDFEAGIQPMGRKKTFRPDIDNQVVDNVAAEVVDFKLGYNWGNPITFVQRENADSDSEELSRAVMDLNDGYNMTGSSFDTQKLARFVEICGVGYTYIDINTDYEEGESYFTRDVLDPRNAFVIRSRAYPDHRALVGVTFRRLKNGTIRYTCFTKEDRFEIEMFQIVNGEHQGEQSWNHINRSGETNPLGRIPIIEWIRSHDRMGCFEKQIDEMLNLNLLISDMTNDVDQNTQAVWWANDVEFPTEEVTDDEGNTTEVTVKPQSGEWVSTNTPTDGRSPSIKALTLDYDYEGMLNNVLARRSLILQKCHVPQRNDNSGGSTGLAMDSATGWSDAEAVASAQESITFGCQIEELRVVLAAIKESPDIASNSPLLSLRVKDIKPTIRRSKSFDLATKTTAIATLLSHGFDLADVIGTIPLFDDNSQVIERSGEGVKKYQESQISDDTSSEDVVNNNGMEQASNSPFIDGMNTAQTGEVME